MEKIHENVHVFVFSCKNLNMKTCMFSSTFYPPLHHNGKGSITPSLALGTYCLCLVVEHVSSLHLEVSLVPSFEDLALFLEVSAD